MSVQEAVDKALSHTERKAKFTLGYVVATPGALDLLARKEQGFNTYLLRHVVGDWGDMDDEDKRTNDEAVENGYRIMSSYDVDGEKLWVITEWDRSATTFLLPDEY